MILDLNFNGQALVWVLKFENLTVKSGKIW
jgi:hypothetical protein